MKKMLQRIVALCCFCLFSFMSTAVPAYAAEGYQKENEYYVFKYGEREIRYLLDEKMQPYYESDGERINLALPLEHLRVTDEEVLATLNRSLRGGMARGISGVTPTTYHDLGVQPYEETMYLSSDYVSTKYMKMHPTKEVLRIKTSDEVKVHWYSGKRISYVVYYYSAVDEMWCEYEVDNINCSNDIGSGLDLISGQLFPYVYYKVKSDSLSSAKITCWCTDV